MRTLKNARMGRTPIRNALVVLLLLFMAGCHQLRWNEKGKMTEMAAPPQSVQAVFAKYPDKVIRLDLKSPGYSYNYDIGEKDEFYHDEKGTFVLSTAELRLKDKMPKGKVIVDVAFKNQLGTTLEIQSLDLMRLTPKIDAEGDLRYPEMILEELNRFGVSFRKEHEEFTLYVPSAKDPQTKAAANRAYRASITNNCLLPGKWEVAITSEDYQDFSSRRKSGKTINQNRILSHSWFQLEDDLYTALLELKNPGKAYPTNLNFDSISDIAEQVVVDFEEVRPPLRRNSPVKILEIGHKSGRKVVPIDVEEHFKRDFGLVLDLDTSFTFSSILNTEVRMAKFMDAGFYRENTPREFDFNWLRDLDSVVMDIVDVEGSETYVQIRLTGKWAWYEITLGNVDLALLDEQKRRGTLFGINTYPKSRRFNPAQPTINYDPDFLPKDRIPYLLLTEKASGKWVNNQYKGVEKIYLSYETRQKDVLEIYLLSYERIIPIWMGRVKLSKRMRELVRIRQQLYNY